MATSKPAFKPTPSQEMAITAGGGAITVSAAAGSGKTRVLVERVIHTLREGRSSADRLLILTFTNTAAAEMKNRIAAAIDKLIEEEPGNDYFRRQQLLLGSADICTIDSFCSKIVRENFYRLGISRDFRIGSVPELTDMQMKLIAAMAEERYAVPDSTVLTEQQYQKALRSSHSFSLLSMILTKEKSDYGLENALQKLYEKYIAHAFPEEWMQQCTEMYAPSLRLNDSVSARYIFGLKKEVILKTIADAGKILEQARSYEDSLIAAKEKKEQDKKKPSVTVYVNILGKYQVYEDFLTQAAALLSAGETDIEAFSALVDQAAIKTISVGGSRDSDVKDAAKLLNEINRMVNERIRPAVQFTQELFRKNNEQLYPVMQELQDFLKELDERFFKAKCDKNMLDFHDLEALMLRLLYERTADGQIILTDFAKEMSGLYDEIMIDEYQDTNDIQESIFSAISRSGENLFVVGDVKQSIYRFRDAKPELFNTKCERSQLYSKDNPLFPALIVLDRNFRSRQSIIDSVNYVFGLLMSRKSGDIEYDELHRLTREASYPDTTDTETELHVIEYKKAVRDVGEGENADTGDDDDDADKEETEALYCASLIRKMLDSGYQVKENDTALRPARPGDFCILLRAVRNRAYLYANELEKLGIPSYTDTEYNLLERYEIKAAIACLKVLSNPLSDNDLIAAMLCPAFGFTPDDLVKLKKMPGRYYYKKLLYICEAEDKLEEKAASEMAGKKNHVKSDDSVLKEKCKVFFDLFRQLRTAAASMPVDKLLMELFEKTGFISVMCAMPEGESRMLNLRRLLHYAANYESSTAGGLTGFIRHIKGLEEIDSGIKVSDTAVPDAVRIMTIHHSKGLEFPICILASSNSKGKNDASPINYHSTLGFGARAMDEERLLRFDTVQRCAIKMAVAEEEKSEMLRVLYVAMTRPKEKLIILSTINCSSDNYMDAAAAGTDENTAAENTDEAKNRLTAYQTYLNRLAGKISGYKAGEKIDSQAVRGCETFSDMLIMCSLLNSSMLQLREDALVISEDSTDNFRSEAVTLPLLDSQTPWRYYHCPDAAAFAEEVSRTHHQIEQQAELSGQTDQELMAFLKDLFEEETTDISTVIPTKVSASTLAHSSSIEAISLSEPSFVTKEKVSATERGTVFHKFLQHCDFRLLQQQAANGGTFDEEKQRIADEKLMTADQLDMIDDKAIAAFAKDPLCERMVKAVGVYPEYQFTVDLPGKAALINEMTAEKLSACKTGCKTILQGAMDCVIEEEKGIVIVDYKTDRVKEAGKLADIYGLQLRLYALAAEKLFDKPVTDCYIYSLHCGCSVHIPPDDKLKKALMDE